VLLAVARHAGADARLVVVAELEVVADRGGGDATNSAPARGVRTAAGRRSRWRQAVGPEERALVGGNLESSARRCSGSETGSLKAPAAISTPSAGRTAATSSAPALEARLLDH
jgi:hypothetical protein